MINVRIYHDSKQIDSIQFMTYSITNKYACISALDKAIGYANGKYGIKKYEFALLSYADSTDMRVKRENG